MTHTGFTMQSFPAVGGRLFHLKSWQLNFPCPMQMWKCTELPEIHRSTQNIFISIFSPFLVSAVIVTYEVVQGGTSIQNSCQWIVAYPVCMAHGTAVKVKLKMSQ